MKTTITHPLRRSLSPKLWIAATLLATTLGAWTSASAQLAVGFGIAATGEDLRKAGGELENVLTTEQSELTYDDVSGEVGIYGMIAYKHPLGKIRLTGEVDYAYFQNAEVKLTTFDIVNDTLRATFEVGSSLIPISLGVEYLFAASSLRPYVGVAPVFTLINRTYTHLEGDRISGVESSSAGENEFGVGAEIGMEFGLTKGFGLGLRVRYTIANLFTADNDEASFGLLQAGLALVIGKVGPDDESEE
jgi:outer membrane protein W